MVTQTTTLAQLREELLRRYAAVKSVEVSPEEIRIADDGSLKTRGRDYELASTGIVSLGRHGRLPQKLLDALDPCERAFVLNRRPDEVARATPEGFVALRVSGSSRSNW